MTIGYHTTQRYVGRAKTWDISVFSIACLPSSGGLGKDEAAAGVWGVPSPDEQEASRRLPQYFLVVLDGPVNLQAREHEVMPEKARQGEARRDEATNMSSSFDNTAVKRSIRRYGPTAAAESLVPCHSMLFTLVRNTVL